MVEIVFYNVFKVFFGMVLDFVDVDFEERVILGFERDDLLVRGGDFGMGGICVVMLGGVVVFWVNLEI